MCLNFYFTINNKQISIIYSGKNWWKNQTHIHNLTLLVLRKLCSPSWLSQVLVLHSTVKRTMRHMNTNPSLALLRQCHDRLPSLELYIEIAETIYGTIWIRVIISNVTTRSVAGCFKLLSLSLFPSHIRVMASVYSTNPRGFGWSTSDHTVPYSKFTNLKKYPNQSPWRKRETK